MSFMLTTQQMRDRTKTVTRRVGWKNICPGVSLCAVEKGQGLKKGEHVRVIGFIKVNHVWQEPLDAIIKNPGYGRVEVDAEGFPDMSPAEFAEHFCSTHKGCQLSTMVTRIEFGHEVDS